MMKKLGFQLIIAMFGIGVVHAQTTAPSTARLVAGSGVVEVQRNNVWTQVGAGEQLNPGERVRTGGFSSAALELEPGKIITFNQGTQIQVVPESNGPLLVHLEAGNMRVFATTDIQVAVKDTLLQSVERPLDMQVGLQADLLNVMVFSGAVRNGSMTIRGAEDSSVRTYTAGQSVHHGYSATYPTFYIYPYFMYGDPGSGRIAPPKVPNR